MPWLSIRSSSTSIHWPKEVPTFISLPGVPPEAQCPPPDAAELPMWIELLTRAGFAADRFGCPNLIDQLRAAVDQPVDTVIITALDSDPALRFQAAVAATWPRQVVAGARFLGRVCRASKVLLAVERKAPLDFDRMLRRAAFDNSVRTIELPNDYPQADPTLIVYTLTNRRIAPGWSPTQVGTIVADAPAACALGHWTAGAPMTSTPCAILDHRTGKSAYLRAPTGISVARLLEAEHFRAEASTILWGDLLRDRRASLRQRLGNGELVLHLIDRDEARNPSPCIRCGWCVAVCPTGVHPAQVLEAAQRRDKHLAERAGRAACIECGVCAYACPSSLPLLDAIRATPV